MIGHIKEKKGKKKNNTKNVVKRHDFKYCLSCLTMMDVLDVSSNCVLVFTKLLCRILRYIYTYTYIFYNLLKSIYTTYFNSHH